MTDGQDVEFVPFPARIACVIQLLRNAPDAETLVGVEVENHADRSRLSFIDRQGAVLFVISPQLVVTQHMAVLDCLSKTEFQALRQLPYLVLR